MTGPFWEAPERVAEFAARDPDLRLVRLAADYANPAGARVLDLGAAGGRNAVFLAGRGFDVLAQDASAAMIAETRRRLADVLGAAEAARRTHVAPMDDLSWIASGSVDLVVALGVYQNAGSAAEWNRTLAETARVLARGGRCLVANFTPESEPQGVRVTPRDGEPHVYAGFSSGPMYLLDAPLLDASFASHGLWPLLPTVTVRRDTDPGCRVTANALYGKR